MIFSKFIRWVHANIKRRGFHPWVRKIPGGGHGSMLQYSCLENPMDRGAGRATAHGVIKSQKSLKWLSTHARTHIYAEQEIRGSFVFYTFLIFLNFNITFILKPQVVAQFSLVQLLSRVQLFATPWTVALQALLSMGFSRQEYWSGLPCPPPGIFLTQESNPHLLVSFIGRVVPSGNSQN